MRFIIPRPPSINHLYVTNRYTGQRVIGRKGKEWFEEAGWEIKRQLKSWKTIENKCAITIVLYYCGRLDYDNALKCINDLISRHLDLIKDDDLIYQASIRKVKVPHRKDQAVNVTIEEL